jgi:hypothetical protein
MTSSRGEAGRKHGTGSPLLATGKKAGVGVLRRGVSFTSRGTIFFHPREDFCISPGPTLGQDSQGHTHNWYVLKTSLYNDAHAFSAPIFASSCTIEGKDKNAASRAL